MNRLLAANGVVDFFSVNCYVGRSVDSKANFVAAHVNHDNNNIIVDDNAFVLFAG